MNKQVSVEIGGTKQQIAIGLETGEILEIKSVKLGKKTEAGEILEWLRLNLHEILDRERVEGIGVGFGGPLEFSTGRVLCSLQVPGWQDFKLKEWFEREFKVPSVIINDTVLGGIGELILGNGVGSSRFFYTNIGTGVGGGFYLDQKYYDGSGCGASYLGNTWIPDWTKGKPGEKTRLELLCSGRSIERRINSMGYIPERSFLRQKTGWITCKDLAEGARAGDIFCLEELDKIAAAFSLGLANTLALLAPDCIVIGGGVAKMGEILFSRIRRYTDEMAFVANQRHYKILESHLGDRAVLAGGLLAAGKRGVNCV